CLLAVFAGINIDGLAHVEFGTGHLDVIAAGSCFRRNGRAVLQMEIAAVAVRVSPVREPARASIGSDRAAASAKTSASAKRRHIATTAGRCALITLGRPWIHHAPI